jgi:hypothetical protein
MSLRKKFVNSTLTNKTCPDCKESYPRTKEYFYAKEHRTMKGSFTYATYCITCQLKRKAKWKKNNKVRNAKSDLKYIQSERGFFKSLYLSVTKSKKGNLFGNFDEFMKCWRDQQMLYGERCPYYSHIQMTKIRGQKKKTITNISVDRLVNSLPYDKNNIMFVSWKANNEKGNVSPYLAKKMLEFIDKKKMLKIFVEIDTGNRTNKPFIPPYKQ